MASKVRNLFHRINKKLNKNFVKIFNDNMAF